MMPSHGEVLGWLGLFLAAWAWQNVAHEGAHLLVGWLVEGRAPRRLVPWPHRWQGRWYWARYENGLATKAGSPGWRHIAPLCGALMQAGIVVGLIITIEAWLSFPFFICSIVDAIVWTWGLAANRPGSDGRRWLECLVEQRSDKG